MRFRWSAAVAREDRRECRALQRQSGEGENSGERINLTREQGKRDFGE